MSKASALIPAAGSGERFGRSYNKVFAEVAGRPVLAHTLAVFEVCDAIDQIVLVVGKNDIEAAGDIVHRFRLSKVTDIVEGGALRQDSVRAGLERAIGDIIAIHDGARPMVSTEIIEESIRVAADKGACVAAVPVIDTIKSVSANGTVSGTIDRDSLYAIQTPQTFKSQIIREAYARAYADGVYATDDAALVERIGGEIAIVPGSYDNIKITTPSDIDLAMMKLGAGRMRVGFGYDVHAFGPDRKLVLGGVEIDHELGLVGHSDADVLLHAIADACLGAAALGDIGCHFPDTDPAYKGASSLYLLARVRQMLSDAGLQVMNVDATVICERPKISPHAKAMQSRIAECLQIDIDCVNVKGTTTEKLGFTGRAEGIAAQAVALVGGH